MVVSRTNCEQMLELPCTVPVDRRGRDWYNVSGSVKQICWTVL